MAVSIIEDQSIAIEEKLKKIYRYSRNHRHNGVCPTGKVLAPTLDRWGMFCLFNLAYYKVMRFGELAKKIDGISPRMLTVTLKRLEENGFVDRLVYAEVPPRVEYRLTAFGTELSRRLLDLTEWFLENFEQQPAFGKFGEKG